MARRAGYYWDKSKQAYRTDAGGRTKYFHGVARDDQAGAAQEFARHLATIQPVGRPADPDVLDLVEAFLGADRDIQPRTWTSHRERLAKFCGFPAIGDPEMLGLRPAASIRAVDLQGAIKAWIKAGHAPSYIAGVARSTKAAFRWAATDEAGRIVPAYPFTGVVLPKAIRSPDRYAERAEVAAFLRFARAHADAVGRGKRTSLRRRFGRRLVLMLRIGAHTGARPGTLASAWWTDFDAARRTITLPPDRHKTGHKTGQPLVIYLSLILTRALVRERDRPGRHPVAIFTHERGKGAAERGAGAAAGEPWGTFATLPDGRPTFHAEPHELTRSVRKLRRLAVLRAQELAAAGEPTRGLERVRDAGANRFVFYRLRHTKATDDITRGGNPAIVAKLLGTSTTLLEKTYTHLQDDALAKEADALRRDAPEPSALGSAGGLELPEAGDPVRRRPARRRRRRGPGGRELGA